jgi:ATP-dependent exoDNAse (exonuclease V) beta subunit
MNIEHISVSREQTWTSCQNIYKFKYHLKTVTDEPTPFYFIFGKLVHRIIEEHIKAKGERSISAIKTDMLSGELEFENGQPAPAIDIPSNKRLSLHLNNYMRLAEKIGYDGEIEWDFLEDLDPPNNRCVKGFIDRLIIKDNTAIILDWKTTKPSKWRKDEKTITKDLQLACYCWIVNKTFNIPAKNIKASLYYLEDAKLVPVSFCQQTLDAVPKRLLETYQEIERCSPDKVIGNVGDQCTRCEFRKICSFWKLTE